MTEYERFGLVFTKTWVYKFWHRSFIGEGMSVDSLQLTADNFTRKAKKTMLFMSLALPSPPISPSANTEIIAPVLVFLLPVWHAGWDFANTL